MAKQGNRSAKGPCPPEAHQSAAGGTGDQQTAEEAAREGSVIRAELRDLCEQFLPADDLAWFKERFGNVWPRKMRQL
jgi:hypothetical protein